MRALSTSLWLSAERPLWKQRAQRCPSSALVAQASVERLDAGVITRFGAVNAEWRQTEASRRARFYRLTRAGRKRLKVETQEWTRRTGGHPVQRSRIRAGRSRVVSPFIIEGIERDFINPFVASGNGGLRRDLRRSRLSIAGRFAGIIVLRRQTAGSAQGAGPGGI